MGAIDRIRNMPQMHQGMQPMMGQAPGMMPALGPAPKNAPPKKGPVGVPKRMMGKGLPGSVMGQTRKAPRKRK